MAHQTRFQNYNQRFMEANPGSVDQYSRQMYGMSAKELELSLQALVSVSKGHMPDGAPLQQIYKDAASKYGWGKDRTREELNRVLNSSTLPEGRIHAYLTATGREVTPEMFNHAVEMIKNASHAELEVALEDRLNAGNNNHTLRNEFANMPATARVAEDSKSRNELRDIIRLSMGESVLPQQKDLGYRMAEVMKARHQVADRLEAHTAKQERGEATSLRDDLKINYELHAVNEASKDVGLGDAVQAGRENHEAERGHLDESFDPLESLNDY